MFGINFDHGVYQNEHQLMVSPYTFDTRVLRIIPNFEQNQVQISEKYCHEETWFSKKSYKNLFSTYLPSFNVFAKYLETVSLRSKEFY